MYKYNIFYYCAFKVIAKRFFLPFNITAIDKCFNNAAVSHSVCTWVVLCFYE